MNRPPLQTRNNASFFLLLFALIYLPGLSFLPLSTPEAVAALGKVDSGTVSALHHPFLSGQNLVVYPLYNILVEFFKFFLGTNEWAARMPSIISVLGLCGLSAWLGRRHGGQDGAVAAAVACACSVAAVSAGRQASGHALTALILNAAWFSWYTLGRDSRKWGVAWIVALGIVLVASFHTGVKAFLIFYFPLFFLRRPIKVWRRIVMVRHLILLAIAFAIYLVFQSEMNGTPITIEALGRWFEAEKGAIQLSEIFAYPVRWLLFLLPAALLFWPGFCAAFRTLERDRQCASFMRTIVATLSLSMWIVPNTSARDLVILMPPLAVLAGMHYEYLVRRHAHIIDRWLHRLLIAAFVATCAGLFLCLLTICRVIDLQAISTTNQIVAAIMILVAALVSALSLRSPDPQPIWLRLAILMIVFQSLTTSMTFPLRDAFDSEARDRGLAMRNELPDNARVYRLTSLPLLPETFYLDHPVIEIDTPQELPEHQETVYVMAGYDPPLTETRVWHTLGAAYSTDSQYAPRSEWFVNRSTLFRLIRRVEAPPTPPSASHVVRLYRGTIPKEKSVKLEPGMLDHVE